MTNILFFSKINRDDESASSSSCSEISDPPETVVQASLSAYSVISKAWSACARPQLQVGEDVDTSTTSRSASAEGNANENESVLEDSNLKSISYMELNILGSEQKRFAYQTLVSATKDFHVANKLGEGGFGPVYKGKLVDGTEIAVKKLSHSSKKRKNEFMNEAKLLSRVQHRNVVNLLSYCIHGSDKLLVYEYLPHESLDKILFCSRRRELDWKKRYDIIIGVAHGLLYLHEDSHISIIHRDIKASNILLDEKWAPKIADFGMVRLFPEHDNTRVAGTNGYMAPEYQMHGQLSIKADVYSFGVVVLELISGLKNSTFSVDKDAHNLLEWAWKLYKKGRSLEMMDATIVSEAVTEQVEMCIKIGLLCVQAEPKLRPTMRRVVVMLSKKSIIPDEPEKPGYPGYRYRRARKPTGSSSLDSVAFSSLVTDSSSESSQNFDAAFNASSSSTSTMLTSSTFSYESLDQFKHTHLQDTSSFTRDPEYLVSDNAKTSSTFSSESSSQYQRAHLQDTLSTFSSESSNQFDRIRLQYTSSFTRDL